VTSPGPTVEGRAGPLYESGLLDEAGEGLLRPGGLRLTDRALQACALERGARVVDLGCGGGGTLAHLREALGLSALGVDRSRLLLELARRRAGPTALVRADGAALPFRGGSADAVLMECVLSVTGDPRAVLAECWRVLAPGGRLALADLYIRAPEAQAGETTPRPGCFAGMTTRAELHEALREGGFEVQLWEDHSRALAELAARLVLVHGSLRPLWSRACAVPGQEGTLEATVRRAKPGYFLLVARKVTGPPPSGPRGAPS
jgi:SAM-dependent methyltransferase